MKIFLDSANINEIREAQSYGLLDGVTTNPSLIARTGRKLCEIIKEISQIIDGPVSAEVISLDFEGMCKEAKELAAIRENVVVKIPMTLEGLKTVRWCSEKGIRTNVTLCFSPLQALMAAKAGATYVSPFVGRLDDIGQNGMELIQQILKIYSNYNFKTEIIAASVRNPSHVLQIAMMGADICTIPFEVIQKLVRHPLTDDGLAKFLKDWKEAQK